MRIPLASFFLACNIGTVLADASTKTEQRNLGWMMMMGKGKGKGKRMGKGKRFACDVRAWVGTGVTGVVFEDLNGDGQYQPNENLLEGIMVSDGYQVKTTDSCGRYYFPYPSKEYEEEGFAYFVTEPDGYDVPLNDENVPQFFYIHKPNGTPLNVRGEPFRFGGLAPTGPLPEYIDFPLIKTEPKDKFKIVVSGDPQVYSNTELGYLRDSLVKEVCAMGDELSAVIIEGDVLGDELTMFDRFRDILGAAGIPQYYVAGNHDMDFDAPDDKHSFDTFRREFGPEYYSFEIGMVHFIVMDSVKYPCGPEDNLDGLHGFCEQQPERTDYTGMITERQLAWLKHDLAHVPKNKLIHLHFHIPIHSFIDQNLVKHGMANAVELYEALGCHRAQDGMFYPEDCERKIVSSHAHTHTTENIRPGENFEGWSTALDAGLLSKRSPGPPPFHQIILGAGSGSWWTGDFNLQLIPESLQRLGAPRGYFIWEYDGADYIETYKVPEYPLSTQMHMDILTPAFREWYDALAAWANADPRPGNDDVPPVNIHDLPDTKIVEKAELGDSMLMVNVWNGSRDSKVHAYFDGTDYYELYRTNPGEGENFVEGLDVAALKRQMMVPRFAYASTSGNDRAQGFELFRGSNRCPEAGKPCTPRPLTSSRWTDASSHLWQIPIPDHLSVGTHYVEVYHYDWHGQVWYSKLMFEIAEERPAPFFRTEFFETRP